MMNTNNHNKEEYMLFKEAIGNLFIQVRNEHVNIEKYEKELKEALNTKKIHTISLLARSKTFIMDNFKELVEITIKILSSYPTVKTLKIRSTLRNETETLRLGHNINQTNITRFDIYGTNELNLKFEDVYFKHLKDITFVPNSEQDLKQLLKSSNITKIETKLDFVPSFKATNESLNKLIINTRINKNEYKEFINAFPNLRNLTIEDGVITW